MRSRRLWRFLLEVCFLAALAALAVVARMRPAAVVGVMAFGWVVVALAEWSAWLDRPHFGRGLPPRYYVPQVSLPPPLPREQASLRLGEPDEGAEEEQTWVVSTSDWAAAFAGWPVLEVDELDEDTRISPFEEFVREAPAAGAAAAGARAAGDTDAPTGFVEVEPALDPLPPPAAGITPDPVVAPEPVAPVELPPEIDAAPAAPPAEVQPAEEAPALAPAATTDPVGASVAAPIVARHRIDPFAPSGTASWWRRRRGANGVVEVPARPPADRPPPAAARGLGR